MTRDARPDAARPSGDVRVAKGRLNAAHLEMTGSANESCGATRRRSFCSEFTDLASIIDEHWDDGFIDCFLDRKRIVLVHRGQRRRLQPVDLDARQW